jgi:hypothetical protein
MDYNVQETAGNGRIMIIARPLTLPGCCAVCGYSGTVQGAEGDTRVFIDFQLDLDYHGRVYWCSTCLLEAATLLGWLGVKQAEELLARVASQESELIILREQNERLRLSLASLLGQSNIPVPNILYGTLTDERQGEQESSGNQLTLDESPSQSESAGISSDSNGFDSDGAFKL